MVVMAGDHLDLASLVKQAGAEHRGAEIFRPPPRQDQARGLLRQPRSRYQEPARREDRQMAVGLGARECWPTGSPVLLGDTSAAAPGGTVPFKAGIGAQLAEAAAKRGRRWISIHHAPPAKSPTSWDGDRYFGDVELLEWIEQYRPDMVFSGHVPSASLQGRVLGRSHRPGLGCSTPGTFGAPPTTSSSTPTSARRCGLHRAQLGCGLTPRTADTEAARRCRTSGSASRSARVDILMLLVKSGFEHLAHHAEMIAVPFDPAAGRRDGRRSRR